MEKKFMKYILFGVFTFVLGIAFVGCGEDYDDDISSLKNTDSELRALITELQNSTVKSNDLTAAVATAAKTEAVKALNELLGGANATDLASVLADVIALQKAFSVDTKFNGVVNSLTKLTYETATKAGQNSAWVEAIIAYDTRISDLQLQVNALSGTGDTSLKDLIDDLQTQIDALKAGGSGGSPEEIAEALVGQEGFIDAIIEAISASNPDALTLAGAVNKLVTGVSLVDGNTLLFNTLLSRVDNVFGDENADVTVANAITFVKDQRVERNGGSITVQVSPANAILDKSKISLVSSDAAINDYIKVLSVEPFQGLLTTRASISSTGLWKITFALDNEKYGKNEDAFDALAKRLYAVAVDSKVSNEERQVLSAFDVELNTTMELATYNNLAFDVDGTSSTEYRNRFDIYKDQKWVDEGEALKVNGKTANDTPDDDRNSRPIYNIQIGVPFTVSITSATAYAYYVTFDYLGATAEEKIAWENVVKANGISGINQVVHADQAANITLSVPVGVENIGFRVYAVNADGTLVDPDGKAFWTYASKTETAGTIEFVTEIKTKVTTYVPSNVINFTVPKGVSLADVKTSSSTFTLSSEGESYDLNLIRLNSSNTNITGDPTWANTAKLQITNLKPSDMKASKTYTGKLTLVAADGKILSVINVTLKKVAPSFGSLSFKLGLSDEKGNVVLYPVYNDYNNIQYLDFHNLFNGWNEDLKIKVKLLDESGDALIKYSNSDNSPDNYANLHALYIYMNEAGKVIGSKDQPKPFKLEISRDFGAISYKDGTEAYSYPGEVVWPETHTIEFQSQKRNISFAWASVGEFGIVAEDKAGTKLSDLWGGSDRIATVAYGANRKIGVGVIKYTNNGGLARQLSQALYTDEVVDKKAVSVQLVEQGKEFGGTHLTAQFFDGITIANGLLSFTGLSNKYTEFHPLTVTLRLVLKDEFDLDYYKKIGDLLIVQELETVGLTEIKADEITVVGYNTIDAAFAAIATIASNITTSKVDVSTVTAGKSLSIAPIDPAVIATLNTVVSIPISDGIEGLGVILSGKSEVYALTGTIYAQTTDGPAPAVVPVAATDKAIGKAKIDNNGNIELTFDAIPDKTKAHYVAIDLINKTDGKSVKITGLSTNLIPLILQNP
ncbi:hypothetical protein EZS27_018528 [termite gut metagenome]|uniref:Uncharacterized protein n=1 Tax=termite gut metagenome TaxID=433724 RepID=A0A5J4RHD6_9ZZZZ